MQNNVQMINLFVFLVGWFFIHGVSVCGDVRNAIELMYCSTRTGLFRKEEASDVADIILRNMKCMHQGNATLSFVHIPKTGGTTAIEVFSQALRSHGCLLWDLQGALASPSNHTIEKWSSHCIYIHLKSYQPFFPFRGLQVLPTIKGKIPYLRAVLGHVMHGSCHYLGEGCLYTTLLREPVSRLISHIRWRCWKNSKRINYDCSSVENFFDKIISGDKLHLFYGSDNLMVRMLSGVGFYFFNPQVPCREVEKSLCEFPYNGGITNAHVKKAITNLAMYYPVWGHMSNLSTYFRRLDAAYNMSWSPKKHNKLKIANKNLDSNVHSPSVAGVTKELWSRIAVHEQYDVKLFGWSECVLHVLTK